ncbi:hypothetical protein TIFTF001_053900 [Ficus carica]|uniref:Uncharacterized protein n=2 Tax=Ficus carica TaxID=3494 RepID=A0AA88JHK9_FICCA|nr:hypothetical protein TIFTF001_053895 [Ficus carica]GMN74690.1 hypothetical protein TIFTF001_053900 [Ficus carica]
MFVNGGLDWNGSPTRAEIRCPTPEEDCAKDVIVDLLSTAGAREHEWRRFGYPCLQSKDLFRASSIGDLESDEGGGARFWLEIRLK